mmetsp:Transcript_2567/g.5290  ORF Transcript_2567/g.5290 Transcript_2567/m.5290 type:complete len:214 (+) Transcript_2567:410-1051(+)
MIISVASRTHRDAIGTFVLWRSKLDGFVGPVARVSCSKSACSVSRPYLQRATTRMHVELCAALHVELCAPMHFSSQEDVRHLPTASPHNFQRGMDARMARNSQSREWKRNIRLGKLRASVTQGVRKLHASAAAENSAAALLLEKRSKDPRLLQGLVAELWRDEPAVTQVLIQLRGLITLSRYWRRCCCVVMFKRRCCSTSVNRRSFLMSSDLR